MLQDADKQFEENNVIIATQQKNSKVSRNI